MNDNKYRRKYCSKPHRGEDTPPIGGKTHPLFFDGLKQKIEKNYERLFISFSSVIFSPVPVTCFMTVFGKEERIFYYRLVSLAIVLRHINMTKGIETPTEGRTIGYLIFTNY